MSELREFEALYRRWRADILYFARSALRFAPEHGHELSRQQVALLKCVQDETKLPPDQRKKRVGVKSGQGTGKTTIETIIAFWRTIQEVGSRTVVTAPSQVQLENIWMTEARTHLARSDPMFRGMITDITARKLVFCGVPQWRIETRSASRPENFQGIHQKNLTIIIDEASGVSRHIIQTAKGTLTNENSLLVAAGNPNTRECAFFDFFYRPSERKLWNLFTFNSEDSPLVAKSNIHKLAAEYGMNSDIYRVRVLGEFPLADPNAVLTSDDVWSCIGTSMVQCSRMSLPNAPSKAISIDFARFGSDESVIYRRSGLAVVEGKAFSVTEPLEVVRAAMKMQRRAGWKSDQCQYIVDAGGMGQGILGVLYDEGKRVFEFHSQGYSSRPDFADKITEAYFGLKSLTRKRRIRVPDDEILVSQLCGRLYHTNAKGKLALEKKDDYIKRANTGSPDRADALAMLFYDAALSGARIL